MPAPSNEMDWTDQTVATLRLLWSEGHSTAEIGRRMDTTKNAIVGKAHRLDLPARPSPIRAASPHRCKVAPRITHQSWHSPASCRPPSCQHRLLSPLLSTPRHRRPPGGPAHASGRSASLARLASTCAVTSLRRASRTAPATAAAPTCSHATLPTPSPRPDGEPA